ncbi:unnamed protein product [Peniophora sp. CBMAI 1063]|nr:unnamed protein product [Peniophora sp. CBMAI 1063]
MFVASTAPAWLAAPAEQRLNEISAIVKSSDCPPDYVSSLAADRTALLNLAAEIQHYVNVHTSPPILRLSFEILAMILDEHAQTSSIGECIKMGHVCKQLRAVVLGRRAFWGSLLFIVRPEDRADILSRTGSAPLDFHFSDLMMQYDSELFKLAKENLSRTRSLVLAQPQTEFFEWSNDPRALCSTPFPRAEHLDLSFHNHQRINVRDLSTLNAPMLKSLRLSNVFIPFPTKNITVLHLKGPCYPHDYEILDWKRTLPQFSDFLQMLKECVELEQLHIENTIPNIVSSSSADPLPHKVGPVVLPKLNKLSTRDAIGETYRLCQRLSLPSIESIQLDCDPYYFHEDTRFDVSPFHAHERVGLVSRLAELMPQTVISGLVVGAKRDRGEATWCLLESAPGHHYSRGPYDMIFTRESYTMKDHRPIFDVRYEKCQWNQGVAYLHLIDQLIPFIADVRSAHISCDDEDPNGEDVVRLCAAMKNLTTLSLSELERAALLALSVPASAWAEDRVDVNELSVPHLEHLSLDMVGYFWLEEDGVRCYGDDNIDPLFEMVSSRARAGIPLQSLTFVCGSYLTEDEGELYVERLKEHVSSVDLTMWREDGSDAA